MSKMFTVPAGTVLFQEGEVNMDMYKIVFGNVELYTGYGTEKESILGIVGKGRFIGEMGLLAQKPSPYTVVAYKDVTLIRIQMGDIDDYIAHNYHDILELMKQMAETTYKLKYSMDMLVDDVITGKARRDEALQYSRLAAKQFARYNKQLQASDTDCGKGIDRLA